MIGLLWGALAGAVVYLVGYQQGRWVNKKAALAADRRAFAEGRDTALANAAMVAYDRGHPDIRIAINRLIPMDSPYKPLDSHDDAYGGSRKVLQ